MEIRGGRGGGGGGQKIFARKGKGGGGKAKLQNWGGLSRNASLSYYIEVFLSITHDAV